MNHVPAAPDAEPAGTSRAIAKADECDAAGRHADAISHLAVAARANDALAMTRLGKRLLVGDRAPYLPNDGARLLEDAARCGGAEAPAVLAVLYALGANRNLGLAQSVEMLALAAERGWAPARAQLHLLAGALADAGADWHKLARRIDLGAWLHAPSHVNLSASPLVRQFGGFAPDAVCGWLIDKARGRLTRALVYDALAKRTTVDTARTNTAAVLGLLDTDLVCVLVQTKMAACLRLPLRQFEPITVLHYAENEEIEPHYDFIDPNVPDHEHEIASKGDRIVTFLIYLNDDYLHGETAFPELGFEHKGRRGEALFFVNCLPSGRADLRTLHAGRPPGRGEKWIVSQFIRNRATF